LYHRIIGPPHRQRHPTGWSSLAAERDVTARSTFAITYRTVATPGSLGSAPDAASSSQMPFSHSSSDRQRQDERRGAEVVLKNAHWSFLLEEPGRAPHAEWDEIDPPAGVDRAGQRDKFINR
jgi:hypothetical protein